MSEPIGVMKCWECIEKHARDTEHHLEDAIRSSSSDDERLKYERWIDQVREIRRYAHSQAKDIATEQTESEPSNPEPIRIERGEKVWVEHFMERQECDPRSFRVIKPNPEHIVTICCPQGHWDEAAGRCAIGTRAYKIEHLHPEGEGSCPICQG